MEGTTAPFGTYSAHSGESIVHRANGSTALSTRDAIFDALDVTKYNSAIISGAVLSSGTNFNGYTAGSFRKSHHVRALVVFDSVLTTTQMELVHSYYRSQLGASNMTAWSS